MKHMLVTQQLRRGDGPFSFTDSRRTERLFGSIGRTTIYKSARIKHEALADYDPSKDTCIKAFVRLLAAASRGEVHNDERDGSDTAPAAAVGPQ